MDCIATRIPYRQTNAFTGIVLDYVDREKKLEEFYAVPPTVKGIVKSIAARKKYSTNRKLLVETLKKQYASVEVPGPVARNIESLLSNSTFTVTTAHQPNIFTGPLYFIYKIVHAIRLADHLNETIKENHFVPVYYMGSEDADLDELGNFHLNGARHVWNTSQTGAVGRMKVDKQLMGLIETVAGQLSVLSHGPELINTLRDCYKEGALIQEATFRLVNNLFARFGLLVLMPDTTELKGQMTGIFEDDLLSQTASGIVESAIDQLNSVGYKGQANPREINLFYMADGIRERIRLDGEKFKVSSSSLVFDKHEMLAELKAHPERFSPNVILRGLYQSLILPDIAFVGGGGELAYWLQFKSLFAHYKVPFPVLVLRNSFLLVEKTWREKISRLGLTAEDFFMPESTLLNRIVERDTRNKVKLNGAFEQTEMFYEQLKKQGALIDSTLAQHIDALKTRTIQTLHELEKKMLRAEKRKFADQQRQLQTIRSRLFPGGELQERSDNFMSYHAKWGKDFIEKLYQHSLNLEQEFVILEEV